MKCFYSKILEVSSMTTNKLILCRKATWKNFYYNDNENGNDNDNNNNANDNDDIDNNNVNLNWSNNDNDNKPYLPRVRSRWTYLRTLILRPITLTYLLGFLWNIRPKEVAKLTSGYIASYKGT